MRASFGAPGGAAGDAFGVRARPSITRLARTLLVASVVATGSFGSGAPVGSPGRVATVAAAGVCTGWASDVVPPDTIRVLRTSSATAGTVETVPFRQYVAVSMAAEWGVSGEAGRVGAIAVKQYAWYWTMNWRGKKAGNGACYDVVDSTVDQLYRPERDTPLRSQADLIDGTWTTTLQKNGRFFPTGYRMGALVACGADSNGLLLFQVSLYRCAAAGMLMDQMLHRYLDPGLQIIRPGSGDSTGDGLGDVVVVSPGTDPAVTAVRLYSAGKTSAPTTVVTTAFGVPSIVAIASSATVFRQFVDVTGDRLDDMVVLLRLDAARYQIWYAPATGDGFGGPQFLWDSAFGNVGLTPTALVRFVAGDMTGDGRPDLGLLVGEPGTGPQPQPVPAPTPTPTPTPGESAQPVPSGDPGVSFDPGASFDPGPSFSSGISFPPGISFDPGASPSSAPTLPPVPPTPGPVIPSATLWLFEALGSGAASGVAGFSGPTLAWTGPLDLAGTVAFAGDVTGDSLADLIVQVDLTRQAVPGVGLREVVVSSDAVLGSAPEPWLDLPDTPFASAKTLVADVNRDGLADLVIDRPLGANGSQLLGLLSTGAGFTIRSLWSNRGSFRWSASRIASADVNADGRGDVVVLYNAGAGGSKLYQFLSTGTSLRSGGSTTDPSLPWSGAAPY